MNPDDALKDAGAYFASRARRTREASENKDELSKEDVSLNAVALLSRVAYVDSLFAPDDTIQSLHKRIIAAAQDALVAGGKDS
jgi:hypothetical protein